MGENMTKAPSRVCCNTPQVVGVMGLDQASDKEKGKYRVGMCNYLFQRNTFLSFPLAK